MPLPKDMDKCMSKVKKEFPSGRSSTPKNKKQAHKQHVAMCLNASHNIDHVRKLNFKTFLLNEKDGKVNP